jgi:translation initiation factor 1
MSKNKPPEGIGGIVFSTNPNFSFEPSDDHQEPLQPGQQKLRIHLDKKQRGGKVVTLIKGFEGPETAMEELAKYLKSRCGVGGGAKDGEILIQGDHRDRVLALLLEKGYSQTRKSGG